MNKSSYASKEGLLTLQAGDVVRFDHTDNSGSLAEIHRVLTGWIYIFNSSKYTNSMALFVPDVLNIEMHKTAWPISL